MGGTTTRSHSTVVWLVGKSAEGENPPQPGGVSNEGFYRYFSSFFFFSFLLFSSFGCVFII